MPDAGIVLAEPLLQELVPGTASCGGKPLTLFFVLSGWCVAVLAHLRWRGADGPAITMAWGTVVSALPQPGNCWGFPPSARVCQSTLPVKARGKQSLRAMAGSKQELGNKDFNSDYDLSSDGQRHSGNQSSFRVDSGGHGNLEDVQSWTENVIVGLNLCPWATKSHDHGLIRYVTCQGTKPSDVVNLILKEALSLTSDSVAPLSTTLIACPYVAAWKDFHTFDGWMNSARFREPELKAAELERKVSLVSFHPDFLRWRALPEDIKIGSAVQLQIPQMQYAKVPATVIETNSTLVGVRKIRVRLPDGSENCVPIAWLSNVGSPIPDNAMHQAPHPTIHLIRRADLESHYASEDGRSIVDEMMKRNAKLLSELGWEGMRALAQRCPADKQNVSQVSKATATVKRITTATA